jgi:hypothetical protein
MYVLPQGVCVEVGGRVCVCHRPTSLHPTHAARLKGLQPLGSTALTSDGSAFMSRQTPAASPRLTASWMTDQGAIHTRPRRLLKIVFMHNKQSVLTRGYLDNIKDRNCSP